MTLLHNLILLFFMTLLLTFAHITAFFITRLAAFATLLSRGMEWLQGRIL